MITNSGGGKKKGAKERERQHGRRWQRHELSMPHGHCPSCVVHPPCPARAASHAAAAPPPGLVCSGFLPPQMSVLTNIKFISLGKNQFEGEQVSIPHRFQPDGMGPCAFER